MKISRHALTTTQVTQHGLTPTYTQVTQHGLMPTYTQVLYSTV